MSQQVLSVSQINEYVRTMMDNDLLLNNIAIQGEISNYKLYPSGHHYFSLKDESAALKCVMFKGNAIRLRFRPENGMKIIAVGKISVYPRDGAYQLYCTSMMPNGVGDLHTAFEQLKAKLSAQGLFAQEHKKPIPKYPAVIGIITSSVGAAIHDMLRILKKRYPLTKVKILPVRVQGVEAPEEIASAIDYANAHNLADLLIVGRGGGSIEDLWAFNDEKVARAIYSSHIPVISAVGHEPDVTISDYVADLRASTPSNAAELAVPDSHALMQLLDSVSSVMITALQRQLTACRKHLTALAASPSLQAPSQYIHQRRNALMHLKDRGILAQQMIISKNKDRFIHCTAKLDAMSPLKVLTRGYAIAQTEIGSVIHSVKQLHKEDTVRITLSDGTATASITELKENEI